MPHRWGLGPHQLRRRSCQGGEASEQSSQGHSAHRSPRRQQRGGRFKTVVNVSYGIHRTPGSADNPGEQRQTNGQPQHRTNHTGEEPIAHILYGYAPPGKSHGFQPTDGSALLLHHAGHGGQAHQSCHQEEDQREYRRQVGNPVGIHAVADIPGVGVAVQDVPFSILQQREVPLGLLHFLAAILQLVLCLLPALGVAFIAFLIGLFPVLPLLQAGFVVLPPLIQFLSGGLQLALAALQLAHTGAVFDFPLVQLCFGGIQLGLGLIQLRLAGLQFLPLGGVLLRLGVSLGIGCVVNALIGLFVDPVVHFHVGKGVF